MFIVLFCIFCYVWSHIYILSTYDWMLWRKSSTIKEIEPIKFWRADAITDAI